MIRFPSVDLAESLEADRRPAWIDVHGLRAWRSGHVVHVDLHVVVPRYFDVERLHGVHDTVKGRLLAAAGSPGDAVVVRNRVLNRGGRLVATETRLLAAEPADLLLAQVTATYALPRPKT